MTNAEHIVAWGMNDRDLYEQAATFHRQNVRRPFLASLSYDAWRWADAAYRGARKANDTPTAYSATDILEAAIAFLATDMEL